MQYINSSFAALYKTMLSDLVFCPQYKTKPRGLSINENLDVSFEMLDPYRNLFTNKARSLPLKYLSGELLWYFSGSNSLEFISKYSNFWTLIATPTGELNSAYGNLIFVQKNKFGFTQWEWAKKSLLKDADSRQAIMHFNNHIHQYEGDIDFPCTMHIQFFIRDNKLIMISGMRSQDAVFGLTFDLPFFTLLMQCMRLELLYKYPNLKLGSYIHHVGSLHLYENKFDIAKKMLENEFVSGSIPLLNENPILNSTIMDIYNNNEYTGDDHFFKWVSLNINGK